MDVKLHLVPEGHQIRFSGKLRTGSICTVAGKLHTIYQLIGEKSCACNNANTVTPEPGS